MNHSRRTTVVFSFLLSAVGLLANAGVARADTVTEWNTRACDIVASANIDTPSANRALAIMHTAIYEAVNAITKKYPASALKLNATGGAVRRCSGCRGKQSNARQVSSGEGDRC
jgi:hypothetical protein